MRRPRIVLAVSGASGAPYAARCLETLLARGVDVHLIRTKAAARTWSLEVGPEFPGPLPPHSGTLTTYPDQDVGAGPASGSFRHDGMVVVPCSMKSLAAIAQGMADSLLTRAADVTLKERRRLILVPRETPLNLIHLENMKKVTLAGGVILPANPGFYHNPQSIQDLIDFVVQRILDLLGIEAEMVPRWQEPESK